MHVGKDIEMLLLELNDKRVLSIFCSRAVTSDLTIVIPISVIFMVLASGQKYSNGTYIKPAIE